MRVVIRNLVLIAALLALGVWWLIPPEKQLRLGKDLRGGVSLVYSVHVRSGDPADVVEQVIDVIKQRVDPLGQADISIVRQGQDRIEITMPLPNERVKRLKAEYERQLQALGAAALDPGRFERLMRLEGTAREEEIGRLAQGSESRARTLRQAAEAYDAAVAARRQLDQVRAALRDAQARGATGDEVVAIQAQVEAAVAETARSELAYERARAEALRAAVSPAEVRRALLLSHESRSFRDPRTGQVETIPSPRQRALDRLRHDHPEMREQIDAVVAAYERYVAERVTLDDPADLKRLLAGAGVLEFRITPRPDEHPEEERLRRELRERGPRNVRSTDVRWYRINRIDSWYDRPEQFAALRADPAGYFAQRGLVGEEFDGEYYILAWDVPGKRLTQAEGNWRVEGAGQTTDERGFPAIAFSMNPVGASLLGELTRKHLGEQMAIVLDDEVYTAPVLQGVIHRHGQITGQFSETELRYIIRVLSAGAMHAKLSPEPISESVLGPRLGLDNLRKGLRAGVVALVIVGGFMIVYYFGCGVVAVVALMCNGLLLLAVMSLMHAAFTMPGIAGVILTFGMAVDANVLVYERMREEMQRGADVRTALRLGYSRALSAIVDGNITNLIVCLVLYNVGTPEIRGFAITLGVGVLTTLFSALVISRQIFAALIEYGPWRRVRMLPQVIPALDRALRWPVDWLRWRWVFWGISACYVGLGLGMVVFQGREMLDNEFRGGTQVTIELTRPMPRREVEQRVHAVGLKAVRGEPLALLRTADVLPVDPGPDGVTSTQFTIKTLAQDTEGVLNALTAAFADVTESQPALTFAGSEQIEGAGAPAYRILGPVLGDNIDRPRYRDDVRAFVGGLAIVLEDIEPPQPVAAVAARLEQERTGARFSATLAREVTVRVLEGDEQAARSVAVLVRDPVLSFFEDERRFDVEVRDREWELVRAALTQASLPATVQTFSATIAATFTAQAVAAVVLSFLLIGIYIWVRFGALNYALAAVVPLVHDVLTAIGLVALAEIVYNAESLQGVARSLGLLPFKIDLNMIAAFLTIVGYSLNDSIIIMDRIRENRGKLPQASRVAVNSAVSQTISRTIITSGTTLMAVVVLYLLGGEGIRGFAFVLLVGVGVGTYSSIAMTAPLVWSRRSDRSDLSRVLGPVQPPEQVLSGVPTT